jgi:Membrane protein involved in the export of O-antigen and teichoic acid
LTKGNESPTPKDEQPGIGRSTLINLSGLLVPTIVALITVPLYLKQIGEVRYGVLLLAFTFLGYFGAFDLGLGRAVAQRVARQDSIEERNHTFWTAFIISAAMGVVGAIILYFLGKWLFSEIFNVPTNLRPEMVSAIPWLAAIVPITAIISVLSGALEGRQAFLAMNISQLLGVIGLQALPVSAAMLGHKSMPILLASALIGRLSGVILMIIFTTIKLPLYGYPHLYKPYIKPLIKFGGWMSGASIVTPLLTIIDRFLIATQVNVAAVTLYTIPFNLSQKLTYLPFALSTTLYPRFSKSNTTEIKKLLANGINFIISVQTPIIVLAIILAFPFLTLWIGYSMATRMEQIAIIFIISIWISGPNYIPHNMLPAIGRPDIMTKFYLFEVIPFLILLWYSISFLGILGAVIMWLIRSSADSFFCLFITKTTKIFIISMSKTLPAIFLAIITCYFEFKNYSSFYIIILATASIIASLISAYLTMPKEVARIISIKFNEKYISKIKSGKTL